MPSAISWSAASQNSNNSAASQPASKRQPEITVPSSLSQPSSYGCDKCPHHLRLVILANRKCTDARKMGVGQLCLLRPGVERGLHLGEVALRLHFFRNADAGIAQTRHNIF